MASVRACGATGGPGGACRDCWSRRLEVRLGRRRRGGRWCYVHVYVILHPTIIFSSYRILPGPNCLLFVLILVFWCCVVALRRTQGSTKVITLNRIHRHSGRGRSGCNCTTYCTHYILHYILHALHIARTIARTIVPFFAPSGRHRGVI